MKIIIFLTNKKRIQRTRKQPIVFRNTKRRGKVITEFFDEYDFTSMCNPIPFAECPFDIITKIKGGRPLVSTFAQ